MLIDEDLARALVAECFPEWQHLDLGSSAVGDPACDLVIAWTRLDAATADVFREAVALDAATWERATGRALWKALITLDDPGTPATLSRLHEDLG